MGTSLGRFCFWGTLKPEATTYSQHCGVAMRTTDKHQVGAMLHRVRVRASLWITLPMDAVLWELKLLVIRLEQGWSLKLDRKFTESGGYGMWEFHRSQSSYVTGNYVAHRCARVKPSEPAEGKRVEVIICNAGDPEELWLRLGEGVARFEA